MIRVAHDDVVQHLDFEKLARANEVPCHFDVGFRRRRVAARMIVLCGERSYVQCSVSGAGITPTFTAEGVLWIRVNYPIRAGLDRSVRMLKVEDDGDFFKGRTKPKIHLRGRWLERSGFKPGTRVCHMFSARHHRTALPRPS